jgi:tripartite-type tricarboxylate transporter receptor subunit TctC
VKSKCILTAALLALVTPAAVLAQAFPAKPVRIIVPFAAGGNVDLVARGVGQRLAVGLGQQVVIDNRPGSSGILGAQLTAKAPADGYTLLAMSNTLAVAPSILSNPGYEIREFAGVSLTCLVPQVLVVNPALPVRTVKQLIALAKARPGQLSYASAGVGGTGHMAATAFSQHAGIRMLHVPYKGNAPAIVDVISGQVTMMFDQVSTAASHVNAGKLRGLAVTSLKRSPLFPDLPTTDEAGMKGFEDITFNGLVAPAGTPRDVLDRLNAEVAKAVTHPELKQRFIQFGVELAASPSPDAFMKYIQAEFVKKAKLAKDAGIRLD